MAIRVADSTRATAIMDVTERIFSVANLFTRLENLCRVAVKLYVGIVKIVVLPIIITWQLKAFTGPAALDVRPVISNVTPCKVSRRV